MDELIRLLNEGNYSCVVRQGEETRTFSRRGVADLYDLYATDRAFLKEPGWPIKSSERERQP